MEIVKRFGFYSWQQLWMSKCHQSYKGPYQEGVQSLLEEFDIKLLPRVRYLGIWLGGVSPQTALSVGMANAMRRVHLISGLQLMPGERGNSMSCWF